MIVKEDFVLLVFLGTILISSMFVVSLLSSTQYLILDPNLFPQKEEEEERTTPKASYLLMEAKISDFGEGNDPSKKTYRLLNLILMNKGDFILTLESWSTSLIDWKRPVGSFDSFEPDKALVFELEYGNTAKSTLVTNETDFNLYFNLNFENGSINLRYFEIDFTFETIVNSSIVNL